MSVETPGSHVGAQAPLVVVTDDNPAGLYALSHSLRISGFRVREAETGDQAWRLVEELNPDALVLDINLPDVDGREMCKKLRARTDRPVLPIIQVSATYRSDEDWASALDQGADVFLQQPVPPPVLVATLKALLRSRQVERMLDETLHSITDSYVAVDHNWRFLAMNQHAEEQVFRRPRHELLGKILWEAYPEAGNAFRASFERAVATGQPIHFEAAWDLGHGWYEVHAYPRFDRLDVYLSDITKRKESERERDRLLTQERELRAEAEAAGRAKDEFLAVLSHELRTPMNAIVGWLSVLQSGRVSAEQNDKGLSIIHRNVVAQNQILVDLLDVSRIISGKLVIEARPVNPAEAVEAALDTIRAAAEAKSQRLEVAIEPGLVVSGDPDRLHQIVSNLLMNAVKFTDKGGLIEVALGRVDSSIVLSVSDTGEGIDATFLPHVFERFRQADATHTRRYRGMGLGLAIVRHLVELHGGEVRVSSAGVGLGSTFTVTFPMLAVAAEESRKAQDHQQTATSLFGFHVMVVDDEGDSRDIIQLALERSGARVTALSSVHEALSAIHDGEIDLVVTDIQMPDEDGYRLLDVLKSRFPNRTLPVIALTAHAEEAERARALARGFTAYLTKPIGERELSNAVEQTLRRTSPRHPN